MDPDPNLVIFSFTHEGIDALLQVLKLKYLDVSQADITDHTLDLLAQNCSDIIRLNLQVSQRNIRLLYSATNTIYLK